MAKTLRYSKRLSLLGFDYKIWSSTYELSDDGWRVRVSASGQ